MKETVELRKLEQEELLSQLVSIQKELRALKSSHAIAAIENPMRIRKTRKKIARMNTIISEMERTPNLEKSTASK